MTKKHFVALAAEIKTRFNLDIDRPWSEHPETIRMAALDAVQVVCNVAYNANPRFDERRFRAACGVPTV